jgi:nucleotide-binding universal stress UspA family protein
MMITCTKVLYCTDFSESAKAALPFAIDIAKKYGATLHLVSVHQDPDHMAEFEISSNIKMDWIRVARSIGTETEKKLQALCDEVSREWKACQFKMLRGTPFREIVTYARDNTIDLVVMSSRGLSGLEHVLFGSTAERVLRESPCHVLVIKAMKK